MRDFPDPREFWRRYHLLLMAVTEAQAGRDHAHAEPIATLRYFARLIGTKNLRTLGEPLESIGMDLFKLTCQQRTNEERPPLGWPAPKTILAESTALLFGYLVLEHEEMAGGRHAAFSSAWEAMGEEPIELSAHKKRWNNFKAICERFGTVPVYELDDGQMVSGVVLEGVNPKYSLADLEQRRPGRKSTKSQ